MRLCYPNKGARSPNNTKVEFCASCAKEFKYQYAWRGARAAEAAESKKLANLYQFWFGVGLIGIKAEEISESDIGSVRKTSLSVNRLCVT